MRLATFRRRAVFAVVAAGLVASTGCFGSFQLTRKLYAFNKGISSERFVPELVFIPLIPVYGLAAWGDALIANTVEFWTGSNPVSSSRVVRADGSTLIQHGVTTSEGKTLTIEEVKDGETISTTTLHVPHEMDSAQLTTRYKDGRTVSKSFVRNADGSVSERVTER
ncbi:MAG: hypothetical protein C0503_02625 [Gemmatimonas sp.]|nr:hypothetical protein [Gemmatimonas sp.]